MGRLLAWVCLAVMVSATQAATVLGPWTPIFKGVDHLAATNTPGGGGFPDLMVVYAVRVDLTDPDIQLFSTPRITNFVPNSRETGGQTVSNFLRLNRLQVAINGNDFTPTDYLLPAGTAMALYGVAVSQGAVVSVQDSAYRSAALVVTKDNQATIIPTNWPPVSTAGIYTAVCGTYPVLVKGVNVGRQYRGSPEFIHQNQPRTALGLSEDRRTLFILAIDGRQAGYSDGAYDDETAGWLQLLGAYDGINMDGGGSTTLVMADSLGNPVELNHSSAVAAYGRERTVGSHFGVYAKPVPAFINDVAVVPDDTTAAITWSTIKPATTQVEYGPTVDLGLSSAAQTALGTNHVVRLTDLTPNTSYYFRALSSKDGVVYASANLSFVTTNYVTTNDLFDLSHPWTYTTANLDGVSWTAKAYDDSHWLGAGPGLLWVDRRGPSAVVSPQRTQMPGNASDSGFPFITYCLRTHFTFTNNAAGATLLLHCFVDDGAVFYLNGAELYRLRMTPAPAVLDNQTLAAGYACGGDATCPDDFEVAGDAVKGLVVGDNVLAAEVHNYNARSPDITFGVALSHTEPNPPRPLLEFSSAPGTLTLNWTRAGFTLQQAPEPTGPWADAPGPVTSGPVAITAAAKARYYRLRR